MIHLLAMVSSIFLLPVQAKPMLHPYSTDAVQILMPGQRIPSKLNWLIAMDHTYGVAGEPTGCLIKAYPKGTEKLERREFLYCDGWNWSGERYGNGVEEGRRVLRHTRGPEWTTMFQSSYTVFSIDTQPQPQAEAGREFSGPLRIFHVSTQADIEDPDTRTSAWPVFPVEQKDWSWTLLGTALEMQLRSHEIWKNIREIPFPEDVRRRMRMYEVTFPKFITRPVNGVGYFQVHTESVLLAFLIDQKTGELMTFVIRNGDHRPAEAVLLEAPDTIMPGTFGNLSLRVEPETLIQVPAGKTDLVPQPTVIDSTRDMSIGEVKTESDLFYLISGRLRVAEIFRTGTSDEGNFDYGAAPEGRGYPFGPALGIEFATAQYADFLAAKPEERGLLSTRQIEKGDFELFQRAVHEAKYNYSARFGTPLSWPYPEAFERILGNIGTVRRQFGLKAQEIWMRMRLAQKIQAEKNQGEKSREEVKK
jgi:hypothetical protein